MVSMTLSWRDVEQMASVHLGFLSVGLGCSIIAGGPARMPSPSYDVLLDLANGMAWPYGMSFILIGMVLGVPNPRVMFVGHVLGVCAYNVLAALFFVAMIRSPEAAATAWWAYFALGTVHGFNLALMWVRRKQGMYDHHHPVPEPAKDGRSDS